MVKRVPALLLLALGVAGALSAAFLPLQLDPPKHDNPVDPLSPQGLARLNALLTPVVVQPKVVSAQPVSGTVVDIPSTIQPITVLNGGVWMLTLNFNTDMDTSSYSSPGALSLSPAADFTLGAVSARSVTLLLDTSNDSGPNPLRLNTAYTVAVGSAIRSTAGLPLIPASLHYTTGPFQLATLLSGNNAGAADGVFYPEAQTSSNWGSFLCAVFNAPLDSTVLLSNQVQVSPNVITGLQWGGTLGSTANVNSVVYSVCNVVPSTAYTFAYSGGIVGPGGASAAAVTGLVRTAEPLRLFVWYSPPSFPYLVVGCNYQVDMTSANAALSISPSPNVPGQWSDNGCTPGKGSPPSYMYVDGSGSGVQSFPSGATYTVSVSTTLMDITLTKALPSAWTYTFYQP